MIEPLSSAEVAEAKKRCERLGSGGWVETKLVRSLIATIEAKGAEIEAERKRADDAEGKKLLVPNPCTICGGPITNRDGSFVGTGDGSMRDGGSFAHYACYWRHQSEVERTARQ